MSSEHEKYHFSATCHTNDTAVLHCLRALCQYAEQGKHPQIGWGGTKQSIWKKSKGEFTVRFTHPVFRDTFLKEAERLLPKLWTLVKTHDGDPASPQR